MTGRAYIGEMLIKNLAEIHEEMSELVDKQVNVQKQSLKKLPGFTQNSRKPTKKCAMKMKETKKQTNKEKKRRAPKIFFDGGKSL